MKRTFTLILLVFIILTSYAQEYSDYVGAGNDEGVVVTSSDPSAIGIKTIDADGLGEDVRGASRFLAHSTLGFTMEDVESVFHSGYASWIDDQIQIPASTYTDLTLEVIQLWNNTCLENYSEEFCQMNLRPLEFQWRTAWWDNAMKGEDQLRQRVAMALSEIIVISDQSNLRFFPQGLAYFYDILANNAFGNYEDLLNEISLNMAMGFYLSHLNNPPTDTVENIRPDENFAREIMQLFTVGLYELNLDGSRKLDGDGLWIPTYDNDDIKGMAKVFTGLGGGKFANENFPIDPPFGRDYRQLSFTHPMKMNEAFHEKGEKHILGNYTIAAGQTGLEDIQEAINVLFNHPNTPPFVVRRLIQRLVKSNPTPEYIERVSGVFVDNGEGIRGDLASVIKAILLDEEAYECYWYDDPDNGMLRSPMLRYTQMMRGLKAEAESDIFHNWGQEFQAQTNQFVLSAPTVFNFYSPEYEPNADFALYDLVGPEFQILNSGTSSNYVNYMLFATMRDYMRERYPGTQIPFVLNGSRFNPFDPNRELYRASLTDEKWLQLARDPQEVVDYLDLLMTNGTLAEDAKERIVSSLEMPGLFNVEDAAHYALFLIMIDPDFTIMK